MSERQNEAGGGSACPFRVRVIHVILLFSLRRGAIRGARNGANHQKTGCNLKRMRIYLSDCNAAPVCEKRVTSSAERRRQININVNCQLIITPPVWLKHYGWRKGTI